MPEYPDIQVYLKRIEALIQGQQLQAIRIRSPFLLRTAEPPIKTLEGKTLQSMNRLGKRLVFGFSDDYFMILHLMVAGRLHWKEVRAKIQGKIGLAAFDFKTGSLMLTEAGTQKRASLHLVQGKETVKEFDPGGLDVFSISEKEFADRLMMENHTLKRALTDPRLFSGIGNAYSDEILHAAKLSPVLLTQKMTQEQIFSLHQTICKILQKWEEILLKEAGDGFPEKVTAFRYDMAVHGKFGKPCPVCQTAVQRIRYASNETNYCPTCQTGGKLLADRSLSRLLKSDWPRSMEALEAVMGGKY